MSSRIRKGPFIPSIHSDGCTVISKPYKWITGKFLPQRPCCVQHDECYYYGGSNDQRLLADRNLRDCVLTFGDTKIEKMVFCGIGWAMYIAVRLGGSPKLPTPWRWRNNVPYELEDLKSGYKSTPINYDEERKLDVAKLIQIASDKIDVTTSDENTTGIPQ